MASLSIRQSYGVPSQPPKWPHEPNSYGPNKRPGLQVEPVDGDGSSLGERNWLRMTFFFLVGALPVTACSLLLAFVLVSSEATMEETNTPKIEERSGPLYLDDLSEDSPVEEVRKQQPWPTIITETVPSSTTTTAPPSVGPTKEKICATHDCRNLAKWLGSKLDESAKPCQDFYRYVCGTYRGTNEFSQIGHLLSNTTISHAYNTRVPARGQTSWQKAAGLFQSCVSMVKASRQETADLVAWMNSLNLDMKNETKLRRVDAVDMIIRCNLDFGVQVIFSITLHATWFQYTRRAMQLECSKKDVEWMESHPKFPRPIISGDYFKLLRFYDAASLDDGGLADKLSTYDDEFHAVIKRRTSADSPMLSGTIRGMGHTTDPYVSPAKWSTMFSKYTNNIYQGNNTIAYQKYVLDILVDLINHQYVGVMGLRYLIAWSMFRQLVRYSEPTLLLDKKTVSEACYGEVREVMKLALVSPFLQTIVKPEMVREAKTLLTTIIAAFQKALTASLWLTGKARIIALKKLYKMQQHVGSPGRRLDPAYVEEIYAPLADVLPDRFFVSWRKALSHWRHQEWTDQFTWLYDETEVNAVPPALSYGGIGAIMAHEIMHGYDVQGSNYDDRSHYEPWRSQEIGEEYTNRTFCIRRSHRAALKMRSAQEMVNDTLDSENLADFVGTLTTYAAFASLPSYERDIELSGLNMTAEHMFFISTCVKWCEEEPLIGDRYAPSRSRCLVPLMNMPEFSAAFSCPVGTPMNPRDKCTFWLPCRYLVRLDDFLNTTDEKLKLPVMKNRPIRMQGFVHEEAVLQDDDHSLRTTIFCALCLLPLISSCIVVALLMMYNEQSDDVSDEPDDATIGLLRVPEASVTLRSSTPSGGATQTDQPATGTAAAVPTQTEVSQGPVCATTECHFVSQWLRAKLDSTVDPCQDFYRYVCGTFRGYNQLIDTQLDIEANIVASIYKTEIPSTNQTSWQKVAALFKSCISMEQTNRTETKDLVEWMISLNLDLNNDTRLETVDAVDMIVRCNLDFGLEVVFSINFHPTFFVGKMRVAQLGFSQADAAWWFWRGSIPKEHRSGAYIALLRLYGVTNPRYVLLAAKIMKYEKELQRFIKKTTPEVDPVRHGTIEGLGELTKPYVTPSKWSTMFMTYTNFVYKGNSTIAYQEHVLKVLVKLLKYKAVGNDGLRLLIAWSMLRQLARYTKPESVGNQSVNHFCYARVLMVMKMALVSPYLRMTVTLEMIRDAKAMMAAIIASFRSVLASSTWLKGTAREAALRKLDHMKYHVGNPSGRQFDAAFVEELYAPLPDVSEGRFFTSWRKALALSRHQTWADQTTWQYDAAEIMAHELMHGYDADGSYYDENGAFDPWGTEEFAVAFTNRTICVRRSYKSVEKVMARQEIVDDTIDSEQLADFVGVRVAHQAYSSLPNDKRMVQLPGVDLTAERLFFVNHCVKLCEDEGRAAERYAPPSSRCIVPLMNMPEFAASFKCSQGTLMNPVHKCDFW
ncbi:hypothetical protein MTO96_027563 [Rhipicephalus appendiculatus]